MSKVYFEDIHKANKDYPYLDFSRKNLNYISHYHNEIEIVYIVFGNTTIILNGVEQNLTVGDIFIIMPGEIHSYSSSEDNHVYIMKFEAPKELIFKRINGKISNSNEKYLIFKNLIEKIAIEDTGKQIGYKLAVNSVVYSLLSQIIRNLNCIDISEKEKLYIQKKVTFLNGINEYLQNNFSEKILLNDICGFCNYSKFHFVRTFKNIVGMSFINYLTLYRLEKAKSLLFTDKTITQIAFDCGFNNLRSFNRSFQKYYNTTPLNYKKSI